MFANRLKKLFFFQSFKPPDYVWVVYEVARLHQQFLEFDFPFRPTFAKEII